MVPPSEEDAAQGAVRVRLANPSDVKQYMEQSPDLTREKTRIDADEAMFETMMLGLRMNAGVSERRFQALHGQPMTKRYGSALDSIIRDGLGHWQDGPEGNRAFALTPRGMLLQNEALLRLMD